MINVVYSFCIGSKLDQGKQGKNQENIKEYDFPVLTYI